MRLKDDNALKEKVQNNIDQREFAEENILFEDISIKKGPNEFDPAVLGQSVSVINSNWEIKYGELYGNPISRFFKKLVKKLTAFIIVPLFEQQNNVNCNVTKSLVEVNKYINDAPRYMMEQIDCQHSTNIEAVKTQDQLIEVLENKIAMLEARIEALEKGSDNDQ